MARLCSSMPYETIAEPGCNMAFHEHVAYTVGMSLGFPLSLCVSLVCMVHTLWPHIVFAWGFAAFYPTDPMMVTLLTALRWTAWRPLARGSSVCTLWHGC